MNILEKLAALNKDVKLRPHQARIVNNKNPNQIIAHGVGTGKTLTGIAKFEKLKEQGKANKALVVTPAGLRDNFGSEGVKKFTNSSYNIIGNRQERASGLYKGIDPSKDYNIVSYEMFKTDPAKYLKETGADTVIYDEAHRFKNENTKTTKAIADARKLYKNQISLTGSLVSNRVSDLVPLATITAGKPILGNSKTDFERKFLKRDPYDKNAPAIGFNHKRKLRKALYDLVDYVDYDDVKKMADMPNKKIKTVKVPLSKTQSKAYKEYLKGNKDVAAAMRRKSFINPFNDRKIKKIYNSSIGARRLMNNVGSVFPDMDPSKAVANTPKVQRALADMQKHLAKNPKNQAALFSYLIHGGIDSLEAGLKNKNIPYGKFLGKGNKGSSEAERQRDVRDFKNMKKRVMLISSAGSEGLSLSNANFEGMLDPHYNPERMNQMEARGVRAGGLKGRKDRNVYINRYVATMPKTLGVIPSKYKTPDEFIYDIANKKRSQNDMLYHMLKKNQKSKIRKEKVKNFFHPQKNK